MQKIFFPPHWREGHSSKNNTENVFVLLQLLGYYIDALLLLGQYIYRFIKSLYVLCVEKMHFTSDWESNNVFSLNFIFIYKAYEKDGRAEEADPLYVELKPAQMCQSDYPLSQGGQRAASGMTMFAHLNIDWVDLSTKYILNCVLTVFLYKNLDKSDSQVCKKFLIKSYQDIM